MTRHAAVLVDLDAVRHNAALLRREAGGASLCAVVKADGYGHGAAECARAALDGGATSLAVALVEEGVALRDAGVDAPVLVLSEPPGDSLDEALAAELTPMLYTAGGIAAAERVAAARDRVWTVHLKVDTGMHRVGCPPGDAVDLARAVVAAPHLRLGGTATHLATADEPVRPETGAQLERFGRVLDELAAAGVRPGERHAANSAAALVFPAARLDLVRCGIAVYGVAPSPEVAVAAPLCRRLRPAMSVHARVALVKLVAAGEGVSYGLRHTFDRDAVVATVPVGYADGVRRALGLTGGEVLIGGVRRPVRGVVTMDQLVVEVTDGPPVVPGDEVVLLGRQGDEEVGAQEWADRLGTIAYEVVTGFTSRLPRVHHGGAPGVPG